jgi:hypothetical protein
MPKSASARRRTWARRASDNDPTGVLQYRVGQQRLRRGRRHSRSDQPVCFSWNHWPGVVGCDEASSLGEACRSARDRPRTTTGAVFRRAHRLEVLDGELPRRAVSAVIGQPSVGRRLSPVDDGRAPVCRQASWDARPRAPRRRGRSRRPRAAIRPRGSWATPLATGVGILAWTPTGGQAPRLGHLAAEPHWWRKLSIPVWRALTA